MLTLSKFCRVVATIVVVFASGLFCQATAEDALEPVSTRPVMERDYVLIKGSLSNGTPGCLVMAPDGTVRFVEERPIGKEVDVGLGCDGIWNISGNLQAARRYVTVDENGTLVVSEKANDKVRMLFLYPGERGRDRKIKIVLRDTERMKDFTLKFERKAEIVSNKDETESVRTHRVVAREGLGGEEFRFEGFSK